MKTDDEIDDDDDFIYISVNKYLYQELENKVKNAIKLLVTENKIEKIKEQVKAKFIKKFNFTEYFKKKEDNKIISDDVLNLIEKIY